MNVVAKFIRVNKDIVRVDKITRVWCRIVQHIDAPNEYTTCLRQSNTEAPMEWDGDIRDQIWELLQLGSDTHLDPDDKLREMVSP
jgi:hypothetical protein